MSKKFLEVAALCNILAFVLMTFLLITKIYSGQGDYGMTIVATFYSFSAAYFSTMLACKEWFDGSRNERS